MVDKKKQWKSSGVGVCSNKVIYGNSGIDSRGKKNYLLRGFYPFIRSVDFIKRDNYNEIYCKATGCLFENIKGYKYEPWYSSFPKNSYQFWGDEHWLEINPNGKTVNYISSFLEKLIRACEADIDEIEDANNKENTYKESHFRNFINQFDWIFAKTYANKAPHEYIVLNKIGNEHKEEFITIAQFIRQKGFKAFYYSRERGVLL